MYKILTLSALVTFLSSNVEGATADSPPPSGDKPRSPKLATVQSDEVIGKKLEAYLEKRDLLKPLQAAGSLDNIKDSIIYGRVFNALYEFALLEKLPLPE